MLRLLSGRLGGRRHEILTSSIDVLPTTLGLAGIGGTKPDTVQGRDLSGVVLGTEAAIAQEVFFHTSLVPRSIMTCAVGKGGDRKFGHLVRLFPDEDEYQIWVGMRRGDKVYKLRRSETDAVIVEAFAPAVLPSENSRRVGRSSDGAELSSSV